MSRHVALTVLVNLRVTDPHTSAFEVLGLKGGPTTPSFFPLLYFFLKQLVYTL